MVNQYGVCWVDLNPPKGSEYGKVRPCVIISPDELNEHLATVVIAPLTSVLRHWPFRCPVTFNGKKGEIAVDQLRVIDKSRLKGSLGTLSERDAARLKDLIRETYVD